MMPLFHAIVEDGTIVSHHVNVRARDHAEAEHEALLSLGLTYDDVTRISTAIIPETH